MLKENMHTTIRYGAEFATPWPLRTNPHLDRAREIAIIWMKDFGLLYDESSVEDFVNWRLAEVASFFYPDASADDCALAAQMMGWFFLPFDDQLDGKIGRDPQRVARIATALIGVVHGSANAADFKSNTIRAFADLWSRMTQGISEPLRGRLQYNWSSYFSSQVTEAIDRKNGYRYTNLDSYFALRATTTCAFGQNDLAEKWGGIEVPCALWHHPILAKMRQLGADLVAIRNDSMSTNHEDETGLHNTIFIIEQVYSCNRGDAVARASKLAQDKVDQLVALEEHALPRLFVRLDESHRRAVRGYADIIHNWICGDYEWELISTRNVQHRQMPEWATNLLVDCER